MGCQDFYPGEALLALANEYRLRPSTTLQRVFHKAFPYYRRYFDEHPSPYFVAWHAKAWSTHHFSRPLGEYAAFIFDQLDWLARSQYSHEDSMSIDYVGGFAPPGTPWGTTPTCLTAIFTEAFIHGMNVAIRIGDRERQSRYRQVIRLGLRIVLRLQLRADGAIYFNRSPLAVGSITYDLNTYVSRCDFNLHALTCLISAAEATKAIRLAD